MKCVSYKPVRFIYMLRSRIMRSENKPLEMSNASADIIPLNKRVNKKDNMMEAEPALKLVLDDLQYCNSISFFVCISSESATLDRFESCAQHSRQMRYYGR
jgi:hypothetical protein